MPAAANTPIFSNYHRWLKYFVWAIVITGIALRVVVYLQANDMYLDEANVARNIYERSFSGLLKPLAYAQYAPPLFLWIVKATAVAGNYTEYGYRVLPLLCGIASLCMLLLVGRQFSSYTGLWYALLLLAVSPVCIEFSCVTKQYIPDLLVTLLLLWMALNYNLQHTTALKLFFIWFFAGSMAIGLSMPSVFILAGVGLYYFLQMHRQKNYAKLWFIITAGFVWLLLFGLYYWFILRPQANSAYLQNYHHDYFLFLPTTLKLLRFDAYRLADIIVTLGGHTFLSLLLHTVCILTGFGFLVRQKDARLVLLASPMFFLIFAAALRQYSLIPRLVLFAMPLLLIFLSVGLGQLFKLRFTIVRLALAVVAVICAANYNALKHFVKPMQREQMTESLAFMKQHAVKGNNLYIANLAEPAYLYYTAIHPAKAEWKTLIGGKVIGWGANIDSIAQTFPPNATMLYGWDEPAIISAEQTGIQRYHPLADSNIVRGGKVYMYQ